MRPRAPVAVALLAALALSAEGCRDEPPPPPPRTVPSFVPPLNDAQVGEWVRLQAGSYAELYRIVGATDYEVTVEKTAYHDDAPMESPVTFTWHRNSFGLPQNTVVRAIDRDRIVVAGKHWDCWRLSVYSRDAAPRVYWVTDEVPAHGVLKVATVTKGEPDEPTAAKLVDWGPR